ncbi:MAG: Ldh family oxidoreductase [Planctomycetia bacterium]|nr:Ldh family oxidoreductase [Planctomycetia bacterium]
MPTFSPDALTDFAIRLLVAGGIGAEESALIARSLVGANLRGHDSHGVMRIPSYLDACRKGEVVPGAPLTAIRQSPGVFIGDAHWGFGQTQAQRLTRTLVEMAGQNGLAVGTLIHSSHIGRLGEYCEMVAESGLVSMVMANTHGHARRVAPPGGKAPRLGTNPLAIGAPAPGGALVLDFGTSATAEGKVRVKRIAGELCPNGWLLDCNGKPTNDPNTLYGHPPGTILPMGGDQAYKGFGLGLMVEIFAGALSGGVCIREVPINPNGNCVFMLAINPGNLGGAEHFAKEVAGLTQFVRSCPTVEGNSEILLPGDPERRTLARRTQHGIPLDEGNWGELTRLARELGVAIQG